MVKVAVTYLIKSRRKYLYFELNQIKNKYK